MQGSSFTSYGRLLKPQYDDKVYSVRKSVRGYNLPSARNIVRKLFLDDKINLNKFKDLKNVPNVGALMFGQYVAHDVGSKQPIQYVDGENGEQIKFCNFFYSNGFFKQEFDVARQKIISIYQNLSHILPVCQLQFQKVIPSTTRRTSSVLGKKINFLLENFWLQKIASFSVSLVPT